MEDFFVNFRTRLLVKITAVTDGTKLVVLVV